MRPAQKAPENDNSCKTEVDQCPGFNEAGAKSAGKRVRMTLPSADASSFNEAGAKSAGKQLKNLEQDLRKELLQ